MLARQYPARSFSPWLVCLRRSNFSQMLKDVPLAPDFPMRALAEYSRGKSGSDLKELCRNAAMLPVRELVRQAKGDVALLVSSQDEVSTRLLSVDLFGNTFCTGL